MYLYATKTFSWAMAHRLGQAYQGKCAKLHGHNYRAEVTLGGKLNHQGMVIDFELIKALLEQWVIERWDHGVVVAAHDTALANFVRDEQQKAYALPATLPNSTAECLCAELVTEFQAMLHDKALGVTLERLRIYETDTCWAEWMQA